MPKTVTIDAFAASAAKYQSGFAVVAVDVIRATTTITTAVEHGRAVYPATSTDAAFAIARLLNRPLLIGELGGNVPYGYDLTNSPAQIAALNTVAAGQFTAPDRPLVLTSSSGVPLLVEAEKADAAYAGCLRNLSALADHLATQHQQVAVIGAGTRGEFRREDQLGCAWLADKLLERGFEVSDENTLGLIERWRGADVEQLREGRSADYLKRTGQVFDLEFVLHHIDDARVVPMFSAGVLRDVLAESPVPSGRLP